MKIKKLITITAVGVALVLSIVSSAEKKNELVFPTQADSSSSVAPLVDDPRAVDTGSEQVKGEKVENAQETASPTPVSTTKPTATATPKAVLTNETSLSAEAQSPTLSNTIPAGASALCKDGTYSFSKNRQGTCSHHGGVMKWL